MKKLYSDLLLIGSITASLGGIAAFIFLFIPNFNMYWLILSPVIIVCYQIPATILFWYYKKARRKASQSDKPPPKKRMEEKGNHVIP